MNTHLLTRKQIEDIYLHAYIEGAKYAIELTTKKKLSLKKLTKSSHEKAGQFYHTCNRLESN